jgi:hypothetical protein
VSEAAQRLEEWKRWYAANAAGAEVTSPVMAAAVSGLVEVLGVALAELAEVQRQVQHLERGYRRLGP